MKINKEKKEISFRATEISSMTRCMRQGTLSVTGEVPEKESEALFFGSKVHKVLEQIMTGKSPVYDNDTEPFFRIACKVEGMTGWERYSKVVAYDKYTFPSYVTTHQEKNKYLGRIFGKTRPSGEFASEVFSRNLMEGAEPVSCLEDILDPEMFGKKLELFEFPIEYRYIHEGWEVSFNGIIDAITNDGKLIVDWKTSASSPPEGFDYKSTSYFFQLCLYRVLYMKHLGIPLEDGFGILAYLVKTKTPKLKPVCFTISKSTLEIVEKMILGFTRRIIEYAMEGKVAEPQYGEHCFYCVVKDKCHDLLPWKPEVIGFPRLLCEIR